MLTRQRARNRHVNHKLLLLPINASEDCIHKGELLHQQVLRRNSDKVVSIKR